MRKRGLKKTLAFIVMLAMVFTMAYTPLGAAYAAVKSSWTLLEGIDAAAAASAEGKLIAVTMTTENGTGTTYALPTEVASSSGPVAVPAAISENVLTIDGEESAYGWNISGNEGDEGSVSYTFTSGENYLYVINNNNGVRVNNSFEQGQADWTINNEYLTANGRFFGVYTSRPDWRSYTSINNNIANQTLQFWAFSSSEEGEDEELQAVPISDALAGQSGTKFMVKGVVTMVDGRNVYIQDETGGICLFFDAAPSGIELGDTVIGSGSRTDYRGLPELGNAEFTKVEAEADKIELKAKDATVGGLTNADVCTYVSLKNLTVTEVFDNNGAYANPNITVKDEADNTIQIYRAVVGKTDGVWDVAVDDEINFTGAVGINNSTLQLRNTKASEITFTEPYVEPETSTIAEALAGDANADFTVKGVITMIDGRNVFVQDATGGICMYFAAAPTDLKLGDTIIANGARATYRGLPELSNGEYTKVEKASAQIKLVAAEKSISELAAADVCTYVSLKNLTVTEVFDNNGGYANPNITVKDAEDKTIQIYRAVVGKTDDAWDVAVGDEIDFTGAVGINNSTLQLRNTLAGEIEKKGSGPVDPTGDKFGLVSKIKTGDEVILYNAANKLAVGNTLDGYRIAGIGLTEKDGVITTDNEAAVWTVEVNSDGTYSFAQGDAKLGGAVSGTNNNLVPKDATYTSWTLTGPDETDFNYFMNLGEMESSYGKVYLEYYKGFTLYGSNAPEKSAFGIQFFKKGADPETPETPGPGETGDIITDLSSLEDGQTVAIYSQGHQTAISTKPNGDWYLKAKQATVEDGVLKNFTADYVWKVKVNDDGTYSFYANDDESKSITVWPSGNYAEVCLDIAKYPDNKWTLTSAKTANSFYFNSPTVSTNSGAAYLEAYVRNETEVFSGYFTKPTNNNFKDSDFALQLIKVDPADAIAAYDDGEWDEVLTPGKEYVMQNVSAESALGLYKEANYALDAIPTIIDNGKAVPGNGAYVFKVGSMGRYYSFEVDGKYLAANDEEELIFVDPGEDGTVPEIAKWFLTKKPGGYILYNKESSYNGTPVCIEYYSSVFSGWTFSTKNPVEIYLFNFYEVAEGTQIHNGVVQAPTAVFDCENFRYVEQDFPVTITLDDLCPDIVETKITYTAEYPTGSKTETVTDFTVSSDEKNYTFTIPAEKLDADAPPGNFEITIAVTNDYGISYECSKLVGVIDLPFFEDLTPPPGSQTGDDLKPVISARVRNAGEDPTLTMEINGEEVKDLTFEDGVLSYTPTENMEAVKTNVTVHATRKDGMASNKMWTFTVGKSDYQLYFGQLHSHTTYSDGSGSLDTALDYIASLPESANVQFVAFTDHSNYFDTTSAANPADALNDKELMTPASKALWEGYKEKVAKFNAAHHDIVAIGGFEMTWSGGPGHINTFDSDGLVSRNNSALNNKAGDAGMKLYYETINKGDSMNQFNHPGTTFGNFTDFSYWDEATDDHMFLVEVGNGEGQIGAGGYYPSYEEYILALDKGWHVAPTNNQDNHKGLWGNANDARDVVLTNDFSEQGIYDAIRERRIYATEDKNLQISYTVNGEPMGTIFSEAPETLNVEITNYDPDNIDLTEKVELVANGGKVVKEWTDKEDLEKGIFSASITPKDSYYFVRITQSDKDIAVTAPVWVGSNISAGIDEIEAPEKTVVNTDTTITTTFFNNEDAAATVKNITYTTDGSKVIGTDTESHALPAGGTAKVPFTFKLDTAKRTKITVTAVVEINGTEQTYSKDVIISVRNDEGDLPVTPVADVQAQTEEGYEYAIEGVVTSNASGFDKDTAFFDCIYVQDETAGICCFPVSGEYKIGDKVHVEGYTDFYQGESELQVTSIEVIGEGSIIPAEVTAAQINDQSMLGSLVSLKGTIESFEEANGLIQTIMVKDANGDVARVFIDGYITTEKEVEGCKVGAEIQAIGLASYDDTFNAPEGPFPRIRIRNRADILCGDLVPSDPADVENAINELPEVITAEDEEAIVKARSLYNRLSAEDKEALPAEFLPKLQAAEAKLTIVKAEARIEAVRELANSILDGNKVSTSKYRTSTVDKFKKALEAAEQALKNPASTTEELKAANTALAEASDGLVLKLKNPMVVKGKTATVKASTLKKKNVSVSRKKALAISKKKGKLSYKKISGNKKITINKKTGKVTVKKGLKKGTYKIKVKVTDAGNGNYRSKALTRTFKIRVK